LVAVATDEFTDKPSAIQHNYLLMVVVVFMGKLQVGGEQWKVGHDDLL